MRAGLHVLGNDVKLGKQSCNGLPDVIVARFVAERGVLPDVADAKEDGENGEFLVGGAGGDVASLLLEVDPLLDLFLEVGKELLVIGMLIRHIGQDIGVQDSIGMFFEVLRAR